MAVVTAAPGQRAGVLDSAVPLLGKTPAGSSAPSDMRLLDTGSSFSPSSADVQVRIPKISTAPVVFPQAGIGVSLAGATTTVAQVANDRVFFGNVATDSDVVIQPSPAGGADVSLVLRSPASPSDFTLAFTLPTGETLQAAGPLDFRQPAPVGSVAIVNGSKRVGLISPARAADAQGAPVSVSYRISSSSQLVMHVEHGGDLAYPLYVDPEINTFPNGHAWHDWTTYTPLPYYAFLDGSSNPNAVFIDALPGSYAAGAPGDIYRPTVQDSFMYAAQFYNTSLTQQTYTTAYEFGGLYNGNASPCNGYNPGSWYAYNNETPASGGPCAVHGHFATGQGFITLACAAGCTPTETDIPDNNYAEWGMTFYAPTNVLVNTALPYAAITNATTYSSDRYPPTVTSGDVVPRASWTPVITPTTLNFSLHDQGLGLSSVAVTDSAGAGALTGSNLSQNATCPGAQTDGPNGERPAAPCPLAWAPAPVTYGTTASTPEGRQTVLETITDIAGNQTQITHPIAIDHSPPSVALTGTVYSNRLEADDPSSQYLMPGMSYTLNVSATDGTSNGNPADARSGVTAIAVTIDGTPTGQTTQPCAQSNCPLSFAYTLGASSLSPGLHTVSVSVTDAAANISQQSFTIQVADPADMAVAPARGTSYPLYTATDTSVADPGPLDGGATIAGAPDTSPSAAPRPLPFFYLSNSIPKVAYQNGCGAGTDHDRGILTLDFGAPTGTTGTQLPGAPAGSQFRTLASDGATVENFARGYYDCLLHSYALQGANTPRQYAIEIAMIENNSGGPPSYAEGHAWATEVQAVLRYLYLKGYGLRVGVSGGSDMESGFAPGAAGLAATQTWVQGFNATTNHPMYDVGSLDGCPPFGPCNDGWSQNGILKLTAGNPANLPIPQIYYPGNAIQWQRLSLLEYQNTQKARNLLFAEPLSEHAANPVTLDAAHAWSDLFTALNGDSRTRQTRLLFSGFVTGKPGTGW